MGNNEIVFIMIEALVDFGLDKSTDVLFLASSRAISD